jgi:hypothetical protein
MFLLLAGGVSRAEGQFVDLNLKVDSKVSTATTHPLHFKAVDINSGHEVIHWGSARMGTLHITAPKDQALLITLDKPTVLRHRNPAIERVIPVRLYVRYSYLLQKPDEAIPLRRSPAIITLHSERHPGPWRTIYIFINGSMNVGNIPAGIYANRMVITLAYL